VNACVAVGASFKPQAALTPGTNRIEGWLGPEPVCCTTSLMWIQLFCSCQTSLNDIGTSVSYASVYQPVGRWYRGAVVVDNIPKRSVQELERKLTQKYVHHVSAKRAQRILLSWTETRKWRPIHHTQWRRVLLEKLTGSKLVKKCSAFYGNRRFITAFTSACHLSLSSASSIQSISPHPTS